MTAELPYLGNLRDLNLGDIEDLGDALSHPTRRPFPDYECYHSIFHAPYPPNVTLNAAWKQDQIDKLIDEHGSVYTETYHWTPNLVHGQQMIPLFDPANRYIICPRATSRRQTRRRRPTQIRVWLTHLWSRE